MAFILPLLELELLQSVMSGRLMYSQLQLQLAGSTFSGLVCLQGFDGLALLLSDRPTVCTPQVRTVVPTRLGGLHQGDSPPGGDPHCSTSPECGMYEWQQWAWGRTEARLG